MAGVGSADIGQLLAAIKSPVRRRARRAEQVTLRVRVGLAGTKPPVWRRFDLASDLFLDEMAASRDRTTTGRRPMPGGSHHRI